MRLLPGQRQRFIIERLQRDGAVQTTVLVRQLGTSPTTVRRDLDMLAQRGIARRVYGGALATSEKVDGSRSTGAHRAY